MDKYERSYVYILLTVTMMKDTAFSSNWGLKRSSFLLVLFNSTAVHFHMRSANRLFKNPWFYNFIHYFQAYFLYFVASP